MADVDAAFMEELREAFQIEAQELIQTIATGLIDLEKTPAGEDRRAILEPVYRAAHSLKGAARAVSVGNVEELCQALETVFASLKDGDTDLSPDQFDVLQQMVDALTQVIFPTDGQTPPPVADLVHALGKLTNGKGAPSRSDALDVAASPAGPVGQGDEPCDEATLAVQPALGNGAAAEAAEAAQEEGAELDLRSCLNAVAQKTQVSAPAEQKDRPDAQDSQSTRSRPALSDTVRIRTEKLDSLLLGAEQMLSVKLATEQRSSDLQEIMGMLSQWKKEWTKLGPQARTLRQLLDGPTNGNGTAQIGDHAKPLLEFLDWNQSYLESVDAELHGLARTIDGDHRVVTTLVDDLLEEAKSVLMLPFSSMLQAFPKMARDISRKLEKDIDLRIEGEEVEIDKRILEATKDPLIHLVRNCIDHGIESPEERERNGKPRRGTVTVAVSGVSGNRVRIVVSDDGAGIDPVKVRKMGIERGLVAAAEAEELSDEDCLSLIFHSGLSTSGIITDLSGRGLGMAIVQEGAEKLGGRVSVDSELGAGTTFTIDLPLTLATFRGVIVKCARHLFVVPTASINRVTRVAPAEVKTVGSRESILLDDEPVALARLDAVLGLTAPAGRDEGAKALTVVVIASAGTRIAFAVDEVLNEQEVLVKGLGKQLVRVANIAGATILGSGEVVPILNVSDLMKTAVSEGVAATVSRSSGSEETAVKSVLVAEDSITSRMLLKNILQSAGYQVQTAVDGMEGLTTLKTGQFDLVVSDVDMPRMNGFELTQQIRSDGKLAELPVVLVTARGSPEDRERGVDAGANAYIVKSSFDQSNLLSVVERLI